MRFSRKRLFFVPPIISSLRFPSISIHIDTIGSTPSVEPYYYLLESECHRGTGAHFFNVMRRTKFETIPATHLTQRASQSHQPNNNIGRSRLRVQVVYVISVCSVLVCLQFSFLFLSLSLRSRKFGLFALLVSALTGRPCSDGHLFDTLNRNLHSLLLVHSLSLSPPRPRHARAHRTPTFAGPIVYISFTPTPSLFLPHS